MKKKYLLNLSEIKKKTQFLIFSIMIFQRTPKVDFSRNFYAEKTFSFYDQRLPDEIDKENPKVFEFFKLLALCHTVMVEVKEDKG